MAEHCTLARRWTRDALALAACAVLWATCAEAGGKSWHAVSVPGAQMTVPVAINGSNVILGLFYDSNFFPHGFLRAPGGVITTFDDPDATSATYPATIPKAMNGRGDVVGQFNGSDDVRRGFVRDAKGNFHTIDFPQADQTTPVAINARGVVTGDYRTQSSHGNFVRMPDGSVTTFLVGLDSTPSAINGRGTVAGVVLDVDNHTKVFLRDSRGHVTMFSVYDDASVAVAGMNDRGQVVGSYGSHGFLRDPDGTLTTIDPSGPDFPNVQSSYATGIDFDGDVCGSYFDGTASHGYVRTPEGAYVKLDYPGATDTSLLMIGPSGKAIGQTDLGGFRLNKSGWSAKNTIE